MIRTLLGCLRSGLLTVLLLQLGWSASHAADPIVAGDWPVDPAPAVSVFVTNGIAYIAAGGLHILTVTNPANPRHLARYRANVNYRNIVVSGCYAFVAGSGTLHVIDVADPLHPKQIGGYQAPPFDSEGIWVDTGLAVAGQYAYLVSCGLHVLDISDPANPYRVGGFEPGGLCAPCLAGGIAVAENHAYVTVGTDPCGARAGSALWAVDISDPTAPQAVSSVGADLFGDILGSTHVAVADHYAYVTVYLSETTSALWVIDISDAANPRRVGQFNTDALVKGVAVSGSYALVAEFGRWHVVGGDSQWGDGGLQVVDISDPTNPQSISRYDHWRAYDLAVSDRHAYLATETGVAVVDISTPTAPRSLGDYDTQLPGAIEGLAVQGNYAFVAASGWDGSGYRNFISRLYILDVVDRAHACVVGKYDTDGESLRVGASRNFIYLKSSRWETNEWRWDLDVINVSNPTHPQRVGEYKGRGVAHEIAVSENFVYVTVHGTLDGTNWASGLDAIDVSDSANPRRTGGLTGVSGSLAISGDFAYLWGERPVTGSRCLQVVRISDATNPRIAGVYNNSSPGCHSRIAAVGNYVYVTGGCNTLDVIDVSNPANPQRVGAYTFADPTAWIAGIAVSGKHVYLAENRSDGLGQSRIEVLDFSSPSNPRVVGTSEFSGYAVAIDLSGNHAYVTADFGLAILQTGPWLDVSLEDGSALLHIGGAAGQKYAIEYASGLAASDWQPLSTITLSNSPQRVIDAITPGSAHRFYRAHSIDDGVGGADSKRNTLRGCGARVLAEICVCQDPQFGKGR
jgi:hypothetical protein